MTLHTTNSNLPKPEDGEPPNGPLQIGALADALDLKGLEHDGKWHQFRATEQQLKEDLVAGTYLMGTGASAIPTETGTGGDLHVVDAMPPIIDIPTVTTFETAGRDLKWRLRSLVLTNGTKPGKIEAQLRKLSNPGGAAGVDTIGLPSTLVTGAVNIFTAPNANASQVVEVELDGSLIGGGLYVFAVKLPSNLPNFATVLVHSDLQFRNIAV